ncbi:MAG: efflux RND transporter periplasmic adaptor subunit [Phycisphaerales bacterium]|nr:efflux RND transporter periplasmic adaptor subunit [Phycisphaerales bacterium]
MTRAVIPGSIIALAAALTLYAASDTLRPAVAVRVLPVVVKTDVSAASSGEVVVQAPGWVEADPFATAVTALADGVVEEVLVLEGQTVEAGQVVARLVREDAQIAYDKATADTRAAQAGLESARAGLTEAERNWEFPTELRRAVDSARARLAQRQAALDRWPAELEQEEARGVYLNAEYQRLAKLAQAQQVGEIELIQADQANKSQQAMIEATRLRKPLLEAEIAELQAELTAAEEDLRLRIVDTRALEEARASVAHAEAALAGAQANEADAALRLDRMEVRTPVGGVVMFRLVEPGSKVMLQMDSPRSSQIVRLYDPQRLQARVDIPLVDAAKVGVGQKAEVIVDVLPDHVFKGHVTRIVPEADVQKNTLQVKVAIEDPIPEIRPEMLARARFFAAERDTDDNNASMERVFAPERGIEVAGDTGHAWVVDQKSGRATRRSIQVGAAKDGWRLVRGGLNPGDLVIVERPSDLRDGDHVRYEEGRP